jgi:hypothetical protein
MYMRYKLSHARAEKGLNKEGWRKDEGRGKKEEEGGRGGYLHIDEPWGRGAGGVSHAQSR